MKDNKFLEILVPMKGKIFQYGGQIYCVLDFSIDVNKERVTIVTNAKNFDRPFDAVEAFIELWVPAEPLGESAGMVLMKQETSTSDYLITTLKDTIQKVQNDKGYIAQAQVINTTVNNIINASRLKLDVIKQANKNQSHD